MNAIVQWSTIILVLISTASDLRCRRIPNRLVVPFLMAGIIVSCISRGLHGLTLSFAGIAVAVVGPGLFVRLGGSGMGDRSRGRSDGADLDSARHITKEGLESTGDMISGMLSREPGRPPAPTLRQAGARSLPCAQAIAFGTIFFLRAEQWRP
jgi:hypothetical protein